MSMQTEIIVYIKLSGMEKREKTYFAWFMNVQANDRLQHRRAY